MSEREDAALELLFILSQVVKRKGFCIEYRKSCGLLRVRMGDSNVYHEGLVDLGRGPKTVIPLLTRLLNEAFAQVDSKKPVDLRRYRNLGKHQAAIRLASRRQS